MYWTLNIQFNNTFDFTSLQGNDGGIYSIKRRQDRYQREQCGTCTSAHEYIKCILK